MASQWHKCDKTMVGLHRSPVIELSQP